MLEAMLAEELIDDVIDRLSTESEAEVEPTSLEWISASATAPALLIIALSRIRITDLRVGGIHLLESILGFLVTWVSIWMQVHRQLAICLLDVILGGIFSHP